MLEPKEVVRVATNNNFNCTDEEFGQLDCFAQMYPDRYFFVNTNVKTPELIALNTQSYQAVITVNPDLTVDGHQLARLYEIDPEKIAFLRIKWLPDWPDIKELLFELREEYPIVLTLQRFNGKKSLQKYSSLEHYRYDHSRYRLAGGALQYVEGLVDGPRDKDYDVFICDRAGLGCGGCGLCSELTVGSKVRLSSLNLSTSGICPHACPDCYAKTMQHFLRSTGNNPIEFDVIKQNKKQSGKTKHIQHAKEALHADAARAA